MHWRACAIITPLSLTDFAEHGVESSLNREDKVLLQEGSIVMKQSNDVEDSQIDDVEDNKAKSVDNFIQPRRSENTI